MSLRVIVAAATTIAAASAGTPGRPDMDKSGFTLWNPVPSEMLRELSHRSSRSNRESVHGRCRPCQIEMDLVSFTRDDGGVETVEEWNVAPLNFKIGLWHNVDLQLVYGGWVTAETREDQGPRRRSDGFGDLTVRTKVNLWGNDGGSTAMALMPFVKFPVGSGPASNDEFEGGLIMPFGWSLPMDFVSG